MYIKKLVLPVLGLFILCSVSYAQFSWKGEPRTRIQCMFPNGEVLELFEIAQKYINDPENEHWILKCCLSDPACDVHHMLEDGNTLLHVAAYYGKEDLVVALKTKGGAGFREPEIWQQVVHKPTIKYRTDIMYAAEHNNKSIVEKLVKLKSSPTAVNKDGQTAYTLTTDQKIKDFLAPFFADAGGLGNTIKDARRQMFIEQINLDSITEHFKKLDMFKDLERLFT